MSGNAQAGENISGEDRVLEFLNEESNSPDNSSESTGQPEETEQENSILESFLQDVPENERPVVEKYYDKWNAGVTRKFQELQGQLKPYADLGDPEQLNQATQLYKLINEDPETFLKILSSELGYNLAGGEEEEGGTQQESAQDNNLALPPEFQDRFGRVENIVTQLAELVLGDQRSRKEQEEDRELDSYLDLLHKQYGDFDEDWVLLKLYEGKPADEVLKEWNELLGKHSSKTGEQQEQSVSNFTALSGGGIPGEAPTKKLSELSEKDQKNLIVALLEQSESS